MYSIGENLPFLRRKHDFLVYSMVLLVVITLSILEQQTLFAQNSKPTLEEFPVPINSHPHDVAPDPAKDGPVWYTAQFSGELGRLDPTTGKTHHIALGNGSSPHGVIVGPDGAPWITDQGQNAIVRVDPKTEEVKLFPLPENIGKAELNTATFDNSGFLWFTGINGVYGKLNPENGKVEVFTAPRGGTPYGITTTPDGSVYFVAFKGNYTARIDLETGNITMLEPPTEEQKARRVWSDSQERIWITEWAKGKLGAYDPATKKWKEWPMPGDHPQPYAVYVDEKDMVWLTDFGLINGKQSLLRFDPAQEKFEVISLPSDHSDVRQLLGRPGEVWGAESGIDKLIVARTGK